MEGLCAHTGITRAVHILKPNGLLENHHLAVDMQIRVVFHVSSPQWPQSRQNITEAQGPKLRCHPMKNSSYGAHLRHLEMKTVKGVM